MDQHAYQEGWHLVDVASDEVIVGFNYISIIILVTYILIYVT